MSNMKGCEIRSGKCVSDDGITIWDPKQVQKSCPYEKKGTYIGIVTNRTITVEALQSTFVFAEDNDSIAITVRNHCGFKYPIPMNNDVIVEMEASLPSQTRVPPPSLSVAERTLLVERKPLTELPDSENVKFQYLYEKLRDESRQQAESVMLSICLLRNSQIRMIQEISRQNPEQAARLLLNRDDITARNMGDALLVSPCRQILADEVYWNHRVGDTCYEFLPVRVNGMVTFAQPRSKDLIESSKIVSCINRNIPVYEQNGTWKAAGEDTQVVSSEHWGEVYFGKLKSPVSFKSSILEQAADMHLRTALDLLAGRTHSTAIETVSRTSSRKEFFDDIRNLGEEVLIELENGASQIAIDVQDGIVKTVDRWRVKEASMALFIILILIGALVLACRCGTYNGLLRLICCCCCSCGDSGCCSTSGNMAPTAQSEAIRWRQPQITEKATGMTTFNINLPASSKIADVSVNREALAMETDKNIEKFQGFSHPPVINKQKRRLQDRASVA
ncbi:hypothetical protein AB6A40_006152 [Gnathostoma spinigerum]|uniref:Envelope protein n=1 Tax=Gnathostoma spinigerum TaxID=75299 RepID=A0ABD6EHQ6_9BILA